MEEEWQTLLSALFRALTISKFSAFILVFAIADWACVYLKFKNSGSKFLQSFLKMCIETQEVQMILKLEGNPNSLQYGMLN